MELKVDTVMQEKGDSDGGDTGGSDRGTQGQAQGGHPPPRAHPLPFSVLQQEQDLEVPPDILVGGSMSPPRSPPVWGSALDGFPPAWPMAATVTRHCRDPPTLPPPLLLPSTAFAHLRRQAAALAALRPRLNDCCRQHSPLPCARRAVSGTPGRGPGEGTPGEGI